MVNEPPYGAVIGVDLGGTKFLAGLFDSHDELLAKEYVPVKSMDTEELLNSMSETVRALTEQSLEPVVAAGYGVPTTIDQRTGTAVVSANLPIANLPIRDELRKRTGLPTFVDNDANVAALAEQRKGAGAGKVSNLIMCTLGTGFGGGIIIDGKVMNGAIGAGAELGHVSIDWNGPRCVAPNCPGVGCIETFCSGSALARDLVDFIEATPESNLAQVIAAGAPAKGETIVEWAGKGDTDAIALLEKMGTYLGFAIANFVNIFNPEMVTLGGGLLSAQEWVVPIAKKIVLERALPPGNEFVEIVPATFGSDAGMVGAALHARNCLISEGSREPIGSGV